LLGGSEELPVELRAVSSLKDKQEFLMEDIENKPMYVKEDLEGRKRPELNRLAKKVGVNNLAGKNETMIERIIEHTETNECRWDEDGELVAVNTVESLAKVHPVLGEYVKCTVTPRDMEIKKEYFANTHYMCTIVMNEVVSIPRGMVDFINKSVHSIEHYYDEFAFNPETGKLGVHTTRKVQDYFCSLV